MKISYWMILVLCIGMMGIGSGCSDSDGGSAADADTDTNTDTDIGCSGTRVWYDDASGLCWQNPASDTWRTWSDSITYCDNLVHGVHSDWRLPDIEELVSLLRGCQNGTATSDLSPSLCTMTPAGCAATDSCSNRTSCNTCSAGSGLRSGGCYWDLGLIGTCWAYWSSSSYADYRGFAWLVNFHDGDVSSYDETDSYHARCVRGGP